MDHWKPDSMWVVGVDGGCSISFEDISDSQLSARKTTAFYECRVQSLSEARTLG